MTLVASLVCGVICLTQVQAQFNPFAGIGNIFRQTFRGAQNVFVGPSFTDDGTQAPQAQGTDEVFPRDCGRHTDTGRGKLCFPVGQLCADRKYNFHNNCMYFKQFLYGLYIALF